MGADAGGATGHVEALARRVDRKGAWVVAARHFVRNAGDELIVRRCPIAVHDPYFDEADRAVTRAAGDGADSQTAYLGLGEVHPVTIADRTDISPANSVPLNVA